ncbi:MAG: CBS domain-containing protein [Anaerolineae bacterium]|nr:CBS domain-containing protein [Anaerolineae bacterium]
MLVRERMTHDPTTVYPDTSVADALKRMRQDGVRRYPVIDRETGALIGIVTEKELLYASPSPVTSLSMHELHYLLSRLTVDKVMSTDLATVSEETLIEEAALLMIDHKVGALPVMRGTQLVGIITETDLFRTFTELFAAREEGVRLTLLVPEQRGELAEIASAIAATGGNVIALGTFQGSDPSSRLLTIKVTGASRTALIDALRALEVEVLDARECLQAVAC